MDPYLALRNVNELKSDKNQESTTPVMSIYELLYRANMLDYYHELKKERVTLSSELI